MKTYSASEYLPTGSIKTLQVLNIVGFLLMVSMNFLANWLPINGKNTGEISDQYENLFTPAGITFSIWGVIYLILLIFTVYQASTLFSQRSSQINLIVRQISIWYFLSSVLNSLWILAWHYELLPVSVAIMWLILLSLILVNFGISNISTTFSTAGRILCKSAFGIYLGWISVATIANMTSWLTGIQWQSGLEQDTWAVIMISVGAVIALYTAFRLANGFLLLAIVWAYAGIIIKRLEQETVIYSIAFVAGVAALIALIGAVILLGREFRKSPTAYREPSPLYE